MPVRRRRGSELHSTPSVSHYPKPRSFIAFCGDLRLLYQAAVLILLVFLQALLPAIRAEQSIIAYRASAR